MVNTNGVCSGSTRRRRDNNDERARERRDHTDTVNGDREIPMYVVDVTEFEGTSNNARFALLLLSVGDEQIDNDGVDSHLIGKELLRRWP